jgi:magnesium chelatase subunit D
LPIAIRQLDASQSRRRLIVRPSDFRIARFKHESAITTIFVVDASGSSALHRLAEAKGAVELLLADCYVRRDRVALLAFRNRQAELLLPPTHSLSRAKRALSALPGGGATPLASGLQMAATIAGQLARADEPSMIVLLTDGRANVDLAGNLGRQAAVRDALAVAAQVKVAGFAVVLLDTGPKPQTQASEIAAQMNARYIPLPHADAGEISSVVQRHIGRSFDR